MSKLNNFTTTKHDFGNYGCGIVRVVGITSSNFLSEKTPDFNNLALTVAYLHSFGKWFTVFYLSIDNITNQHNIFGYRYIYDANGAPTGGRNPIVPALYRSIFVGVNMSLTQFKKDEL